MEIRDYKSNSHNAKRLNKESNAPEKKIEKVISGSAKTKKKTGIRKLTDVFVSEDITSVKSYILTDVIIPNVVDLIEDVVTNGIRMILRGEAGARKKGSPASRVSYRSYYDNPRGRNQSHHTKTRTGYSYDEIILDNRGDAEEVLLSMDELIDRYEMASVADLYELVELPTKPTDNNYGWTDIRSASVERVREGYLLKLPRALPLE